MDEDTATRFVSSLVKSIQALCNGYIDFSSSIEVIGHIHLNIDRNKKLDYVLTEEVSKSVSEGATVFASHSYHSHPPPSLSSKNAGDATNQNRRKSQVTQDDDPLGISSLRPDVSRTHSSSRVDENSDSSQSGSANFLQDSAAVKNEPNRTACQVQEGLDRRRKGVPLSQRTQSPAAKRPRNNDSSSSAAAHTPGFDVIEIKEEPDDEPSVYFGDKSSSHVAPGQDIQTPDFSNVVMESLDRVGQIEGTQLVSGGESMQQQQPFPVMLHANSGIPASSTPSQVPGPSLNPRSTASASGEGQSGSGARTFPSSGSSHSQKGWSLKAVTGLSAYSPMMIPRMQHPAFASAMSRQMWMSATGMATYRPRPRMQYTQSQIDAALLDVEMGKSISKSAKDNGVPFTSLYRRVKARNVQHSEDEPSQQPAPMEDASRQEEFSSAEDVPFPAEASFGDSSSEGKTAQEPVHEEKALNVEDLLLGGKDVHIDDPELAETKFDTENT